LNSQSTAYPGLVTQTEKLILCANGGRVGREAHAKDAGWRAFSDGVGELHLLCGLCVYPRVPAGRAGEHCGHGWSAPSLATVLSADGYRPR
jgi:hypothetical protein